MRQQYIYNKSIERRYEGLIIYTFYLHLIYIYIVEIIFNEISNYLKPLFSILTWSDLFSIETILLGSVR